MLPLMLSSLLMIDEDLKVKVRVDAKNASDEQGAGVDVPMPQVTEKIGVMDTPAPQILEGVVDGVKVLPQQQVSERVVKRSIRLWRCSETAHLDAWMLQVKGMGIRTYRPGVLSAFLHAAACKKQVDVPFGGEATLMWRIWKQIYPATHHWHHFSGHCLLGW